MAIKKSLFCGTRQGTILAGNSGRELDAVQRAFPESP